MITMISPAKDGDPRGGILPDGNLDPDYIQQNIMEKQRQMRINQDNERARENALERYNGEYRDGMSRPGTQNNDFERGERGTRGANQAAPAATGGTTPAATTKAGTSGTSTSSSTGSSTSAEGGQ
jgi:hypothetical protein